MRTSVVSILSAILLSITAACDMDGADDTQRCELVEPYEVDPDGARYQFVIDSLDFPDTPNQVGAFGLNLDGDEQGRPDNAMGQMFSTLRGSFDVDVDAAVGLGIESAQLLHLVEVQATAIEDAEGVGVSVLLGSDLDGDPGDNFSGEEPFAAEQSPGSEVLSGFIADGRLEADLGTVPLHIAMPRVEGSAVLHLDAARIEATISADGLQGVLAGVLSEKELDEGLFPLVHASLSASVESDCLAGECFPDSDGETLLTMFDEDHDGAIGLEELRANILIGALFSPDLDLLDAASDVRPRCDGKKESFSVGLSFSAVPARF